MDYSKLKLFRKHEKKMTIQECAEKLGCDRKKLGQLERGKVDDMELLKKYCELLGLKVALIIE